MRITSIIRDLAATLALVVACHFSTTQVRAQGYIPSGYLSAVPGGGGTYNYTLILSNGAAATENIGSFWYAWIPGEFYLPSNPSSVSSPSGWTGSPFPLGGASSIQWFANSPTEAIGPGEFLSFGFVSTDSPSVLAGNAPNFPGTPIGRSFVYGGGFFSDAGGEFIVQSVPEPGTLGLMALGAIGVSAAGWRRIRSSQTRG